MGVIVNMVASLKSNNNKKEMHCCRLRRARTVRMRFLGRRMIHTYTQGAARPGDLLFTLFTARDARMYCIVPAHSSYVVARLLWRKFKR